MDEQWYYCVEHGTVERFGDCPAKNRLGPYESLEAAQAALELAQIRNERWDKDPAWNDDE